MFADGCLSYGRIAHRVLRQNSSYWVKTLKGLRQNTIEPASLLIYCQLKLQEK